MHGTSGQTFAQGSQAVCLHIGPGILGVATRHRADQNQGRLQVGCRRLQAIDNMLIRLLAESYQILELHVVVAGDYQLSALSNGAYSSTMVVAGFICSQESHSS